MKSSLVLTLALSCLCSAITTAHGSSYGFGPQSEEESNPSWPTKMTFGETKTNYMLGSALLKRVYKRMDHSDSLMKLEINQMYDKLRDEIQKSLRKCDGTRKPDAPTPRGHIETSQHPSYSNEKQQAKQDKSARGTKENNKGKKKKEDTKRQNGQQQGTHQKYYDWVPNPTSCIQFLFLYLFYFWVRLKLLNYRKAWYHRSFLVSKSSHDSSSPIPCDINIK